MSKVWVFATLPREPMQEIQNPREKWSEKRSEMRGESRGNSGKRESISIPEDPLP
jgi:hypothetical protein